MEFPMVSKRFGFELLNSFLGISALRQTLAPMAAFHPLYTRIDIFGDMNLACDE